MAIKIIQKRLCLCTVAMFLLGCIAQPIFAVTDISTLQDLLNINKNCAGDYRLTANVGGNNETFLPLCPKGFSGTLDGNRHVIYDLDITGDVSKLGLFASLSKANVHDLSFRNVNVHADRDVLNAGVLAGESNSAVVKNISLWNGTLSLAPKACVGGLIGVVKHSTLIHLRVQDVSVSTSDDGIAGGVIGVIGSAWGDFSDNTILTRSFYQASENQKIQGGLAAGGLVGWAASGANINTSFVVGQSAGTEVTAHIAGGLIGWNAADVAQSFARIHVGMAEEGMSFVGGLMGHNQSKNVTQTYSTGLVSGDYGTITGGLVAEADAAHTQNASTVHDSFWDEDSTGCKTSAGGIGESNAAMKDKSTYADWDFNNVWYWNVGNYPTLR